MAAKKEKAATDDELKKMFEGLEGEDLPATSSKGDPSKTKKLARAQTAEDLEAELAELENLGKPQADARPRTPRVATPVGGTSSPTKRASVGSPLPQTSTRSSEDKPQSTRKSGDSTRSYHTSFTPSATSSELQEAEKKARIAEPAAQPAAAAGGGWWGGILATASAAVKTAEAAVKEIQQNEEAKRWAEQVKGNVGALRGLGTKLYKYTMDYI
jgi:hypothetical protein